jgi:hypothetical protein
LQTSISLLIAKDIQEYEVGTRVGFAFIKEGNKEGDEYDLEIFKAGDQYKLHGR